MVVGLIIGGLIGYFLPITVFYLANSAFKREPIDALLKDMFGN